MLQEDTHATSALMYGMTFARPMSTESQGKMMKAIAFQKYGKPMLLKKEEMAYPHGFEVSSNVVIKVHASSINPVDKALLG